MKRVGIIGTLVWDTIRLAGRAEPREQWGGLTYSLASLAAACPPGWEVVPIVKIGRDLFEPALSFLHQLPGLDRGCGVRAVPEPNNRVELRYRDLADRLEVQSGAVPGWSWDELAPVAGTLDALYVNFLSGYELTLAEAKRLRAGFAGPIYTDLHSLFLGPPGQGPRLHRHLPHWEEWLRCFDAVQLNETELGLLAEEGADPWAAARELPHRGPQLALVTLGGEGARYFQRAAAPADPLLWPRARGEADGEVLSELVPVPEGNLPGDPTGCGDVWGAACFMSLLAGLDVPDAVRRAHHLAAAKVGCPSTASLYATLRGVA